MQNFFLLSLVLTLTFVATLMLSPESSNAAEQDKAVATTSSDTENSDDVIIGDTDTDGDMPDMEEAEDMADE